MGVHLNDIPELPPPQGNNGYTIFQYIIDKQSCLDIFTKKKKY